MDRFYKFQGLENFLQNLTIQIDNKTFSGIRIYCYEELKYKNCDNLLFNLKSKSKSSEKIKLAEYSNLKI